MQVIYDYKKYLQRLGHLNAFGCPINLSDQLLTGIFSKTGYGKDALQYFERNYNVIRTLPELLAFEKEFDNTIPFAFDTETTDVRYQVLDLVGLSLYNGKQKPTFILLNFIANYVKEQVVIQTCQPTKNPNSKRKPKTTEKVVKERVTQEFREGIPKEDALPIIRRIFKNSNIIAANAKFDIKVAHKFGFDNFTLVGDTLLLSYLINSNTPNGLKPNVRQYCGYEMISYEDTVKTTKTICPDTGEKLLNINWFDVDFSEYCRYGALDAFATYQLHSLLYLIITSYAGIVRPNSKAAGNHNFGYSNVSYPEHLQANLYKCYTDVELPLVQVVAEMEQKGVKIDAALLHRLAEKAQDRLQQLESEIYKEMGATINLNSSAQVGDYFFRVKGYDAKKYKAVGVKRLTNIGALHALMNSPTTTTEQYDVLNLLYRYKTYKINKSNTKEGKQQLLEDFTRRISYKFTAQAKEPTTFNIRSQKHLETVIYDVIGVQITQGNAHVCQEVKYTCDKGVLKSLAADQPEDKVLANMLDLRVISKLLDTYLIKIPKLLDGEGRLRGSFNQAFTTTGRFSSSNPNLQNIPARSKDYPIRDAFTHDDNTVLVGGDYSQLELRMMAHMSQDPVLIDAYKQGKDLHQLTADNITKLYGINCPRSNGKTINFSVLYGMIGRTMAQGMNAQLKENWRIGKITYEDYLASLVSSEEGDKMVQGFFDGYSGFRDGCEFVWQDVMVTGFAQTLFGRVRWLPEADRISQELNANGIPLTHWNSKLWGKDMYNWVRNKLGFNFRLQNWYEGVKGRRYAISTWIQGSAADLVKKGMVDTYRELKRRNIPATIILQVHDEIVIEVAKEYAAITEKIAKEAMENAVKLAVPLTCDMQTIFNWTQLKAPLEGQELQDVINYCGEQVK